MNGNPVGAAVVLFAFCVFVCACLYGVWFLGTHWHTVWP